MHRHDQESFLKQPFLKDLLWLVWLQNPLWQKCEPSWTLYECNQTQSDSRGSAAAVFLELHSFGWKPALEALDTKLLQIVSAIFQKHPETTWGNSSLEQRHLWTVEWTHRSSCPADSGRPKWRHLMLGLFNDFWERRLSFAPTLTMMIRALPFQMFFPQVSDHQILTFSTIWAFNSRMRGKRSDFKSQGPPQTPHSSPLVSTRSGHRKHGSTGWHGPRAENPPRPHLAVLELLAARYAMNKRKMSSTSTVMLDKWKSWC